MIVKVGNKFYDGSQEPVMIILEDGEKEAIASMISTDENRFCSYPEDMDETEINDWMMDDSESEDTEGIISLN